ncbi:unnamed protein product, partial [Rotaria sp. Silwood2]
PYSSCQLHNIESSTNLTPSLLNGNTYRNNNFRQQQPFQRCFKYGYLDQIAHHCYHFEERSPPLMVLTSLIHRNINLTLLSFSFTTYDNNKQMRFMIDTGAQSSFINEKCLKLNDPLKFSSMHHQKLFMVDRLTSFIVTGTFRLNIYVGEIITAILAFVTKNLRTNLILGVNYLLKDGLETKPKKKSILLNFNVHKITITMNR